MRSATGASIATPAGPAAPIVVGSAASTNTAHGIAARLPRSSPAAQSTIRSTVPFTVAIANR